VPLNWKVRITDEASKVFESNLLSQDDKAIIQTWAETVIRFGPEALLKHPNVWRDHELFDEWTGFRASSFSHVGRIIYRVEKKVVTVIVVRISHDHNYKK